jgi:hypothetical protein
MRAALAFYTEVLDFERVDGDDTLDNPSFSALARAGDYLFLSSHRGDGEFGQAIAVLTDNVDTLFRKFRGRGLATPGNRTRPRWSTKDRSTRTGALANSTWMTRTAIPYGSHKASSYRRYRRGTPNKALHMTPAADGLAAVHSLTSGRCR